ncbi:hypothetical protein BDV26DRAFT_264420 [Aspergillus bertholletiae]|uniref:Uncharacterized protein n=1 Tax=Aspergillus bertholletiae TaxID=1226010 RepID=A0A5N7B4S1_9EURO|nr:hypothetical protein BDV26DRAFT_264420 [Aspergillus bertholletiae]
MMIWSCVWTSASSHGEGSASTSLERAKQSRPRSDVACEEAWPSFARELPLRIKNNHVQLGEQLRRFARVAGHEKKMNMLLQSFLN